MLKLINVGENELHLYKQPDNWIEPGQYYQFYGRPGTKEKKAFELKGVQKPNGGFCWIAPYEPWVKRMHDGLLIPAPACNEEPNWNLIGIRPEVLRSWQKEFIREVWNYLRSGLRYGRGWIARVGAGKTLAGLCISNLFDPGKTAVLVDRYLFETWRSQAEEWGFPVPLLSTYESCHKLPADIECIIIDEILRVKNCDAQRSLKASKIAESCEVAVGFTGIATAGMGPMDFRWLRTICPGSVPRTENAWKFAFGLDTQLKEVGPNQAYITTQWNDEAITNFVAPYIHTVDPNEIIQELPELTYHYIEVPEPKQYNLVKSGGATARGVHKKLAQVMQCTDGFIYDDEERPIRLVSPKLEAVRSYFETLGESAIIVTNWSEAVQQLKEMFAEFNPAVVEGGAKYGEEIGRFKAGMTPILIANAGFSKGMNLQGVCRTILFLSTSTKPDDYEQMLGRVHRPGQKDGVNIVHFVCKDTLDRRRIELVQKHKTVSAEFIEKLLLEELEK